LRNSSTSQFAASKNYFPRYGAFRGFADESKPSEPKPTPWKTDSKKDTEAESGDKELKKPEGDAKDPLADAKSYFSAAPIKMVRAHVDKDKRSHRTGVAAVPEGVAGEKAFEFVDPKAVYYPTMETLKELFGGIPYTELPEIRIYLSKNNTKVAAVDYKGTMVFYTSASIEGFKNCKKKTEVAGQTVGVSVGNKCMRRGLNHVRVILSGLGPGRMSCIQGMSMTGVKIVSLTDATPLPELGPRPRKVRRL